MIWCEDNRLYEIIAQFDAVVEESYSAVSGISYIAWTIPKKWSGEWGYWHRGGNRPAYIQVNGYMERWDHDDFVPLKKEGGEA